MRNISIKSVFLLLVVAFMLTCQHDPDFQLDEATISREVGVAKQWYEANRPGEVSLRSAESNDGSPAIEVKPDWGQAHAKANKRERTVETNLYVKGFINFVMPENKQKFDETGDDRYMRSLTRLIVKTKLRNGAVDGFLMTIMPSVEYLELTGFRAFDEMNYIGRDKQFTGRILFHNLEGEFVNGWVYKNGKITRSIKKSQPGEDPVISLRSSGSYDCYEVEYWGWLTTCTDWYQTTNYDPTPVYLYTSCTAPYYGLVGYGTECSPSGNGDGENGENIDGEDGGYGGGGGGGGGNYNPPPLPPFVPKAKDVFQNSSMPGQDWEKLQGILSQVTLACLGESLYNGLINWLGDDKINFDFNDGDNGRFFTTGDALNISIGSHGDADQLLHEMFHAYQYFKRTAPEFLDGLLNVEIETHYAQYLYASGREDYKGSEWEERDNNEPRRRQIKDLEKLLDEKANLRPNRTESDLEIYILNEVIPVFREVNAYKDYSLDYDRVGLDNFDTLEELTTDC